MRLHRLSVTAFGPFVETAEVDFDALSDAGLFLLSGATGAGKSSVLDAVCFALYGAVPGDRQQVGRLRSDQAPAGLAPAVTLEVSLAGRRLRIARSPAWERPKRRGAGTTREPAKVSVSEHLADPSVDTTGGWVHLTSRLDEAGDLLSGLLGMNLDQFCQVALLPQGHFQAFLRADSADRHRLLSRLFRTGRFERIETWLREHRLSLRRASEDHARRVADLVSRLCEAATVPALESRVDLASAADDGSLTSWAGGLREAATTRRTAAEAARSAAHDTEAAARHTLDAARELAVARARITEAADAVERLTAAADDRHRDGDRLDQARRAASLRPLVRLVDERRRLVAQAALALETSRRAAAAGDLPLDDLPAELERIAGRLAAASALLPAERQLAELSASCAATEQALAGLTDEEALQAAEADTTTARAAELTAELAESDVPQTTLRHAEGELLAAEEVVAAHRRLAELVPARRAAAAEHDAGVRRLLDAREQLLDLRERRIAGMAAELAGALVAGDECPVCGSADHPRPAPVTSHHPDAAAERAAQRAVDDAQVAEHALDLKVRELEAALAKAEAAAGDTTVEQAAAHLAACRETVTALEHRRERHAALREQLAAAEARVAELQRAAAERRVRRAELGTTLDHLRIRAAELRQTVTRAREGHPAIDDAVAALEARRDLAQRANSDRARHEAAAQALSDAETALTRAAWEAGFADADTARTAELSDEELAHLERRLGDHDSRLAAARAILDEPDAWELLTAPDPDLSGCESRHAAAVQALTVAEREADAAARCQERVSHLADGLAAALEAWRPVRAQLALATRVAAFAEGKAADNRLQMRLSAYVLAFRLSQVVAAANARLAGMSDRRYSLEHVARRGAGETRGGLSLAVRDDWSGESRDPATLSGGETFVVSLALALGLADVVTHEAGDVDLQTLFVDEGFGSLDAETLDDVLDILDTLREHGRSVGVVSHVPEMRDRIPAQLVVTKSRAGSTLRVVGSPG